MLKILRAEFVRMSMDFKPYAAMLLLIAIYMISGRYNYWQDIFTILTNDELYFAAPALLGLISATSFCGRHAQRLLPSTLLALWRVEVCTCQGGVYNAGAILCGAARPCSEFPGHDDRRCAAAARLQRL